MKRLASLFLIALLCLISLLAPVCAQNVSEMRKGLAELSAGQYAAALSAFAVAIKKAPSDMQARYCYAVCLHHVGRLGEARTEYTQVAKLSKDPELVRRANKGIQGCGPASSNSFAISEPVDTSGGAGFGAAPGGGFGGIAAGGPAGGYGAAAGGADLGGWTTPPSQRLNSQTVMHAAAWAQQQARATASHQNSYGSGGSYATGLPKVIDVYTDWCGWCKKLEPMMAVAQQKFAGQVEFRRINAEAPESAEFCKKLNIHSYPTIVYYDAQGKLVEIGHGCPKTQEALNDRISTYFNLPK